MHFLIAKHFLIAWLILQKNLIKQRGQDVRIDSKEELLSAQEMSMCKRRTSFTEDEMWSVVS